MNKNTNDLQLFKQALNKGVSNKFNAMAAECIDTIECSEHHTRTMQTIVYDTPRAKHTGTSKKRRLIALLVAAALLLTGCGILFRHEIREIFEDLYVKLVYESDEEANTRIKEVYVLGYVPDGFALEKETIEKTFVQYKFKNESGEILLFEQRALTNSAYYIDSESGFSKIEEIDEYEIYYRSTGENHLYVWNSDEYHLEIKASVPLLNEDIVLIFESLTTK